MAIQADDVLAGIVHNQANVALMRHQHDQALALAERSVALHQSLGSGHGLAVALATLGQIFVQLGDLERAEQILTRTLEVRSPVQFQRDDGRRVRHARADSSDARLVRARRRVPPPGERGLRRVRHADDALVRVVAQGPWREAGHPPRRATTKRSRWPRSWSGPSACRRPKPSRRSWRRAKRWWPPAASGRPRSGWTTCEGRLDPRDRAREPGASSFASGARCTSARTGRLAAHHDFAQSANVFDLLGERYQAALSHLALGRLAARGGTRDGGRTLSRSGRFDLRERSAPSAI